MPINAEDKVVAPVALQINLVTAQLSLVLALGVTTLALQKPALVFCTIFTGQFIVGKMLSVTVTLKLQVAVLPAASATV